MSKETRVPSAGVPGPYTAMDGNITVVLPNNGMGGLFACTDDSMPLAYGILALASNYDFDVDFQRVMHEHGIRPDWWRTALLYCSACHMEAQGQPGVGFPLVSGKEPDRKADPGSWGRWKILTAPESLPGYPLGLIQTIDHHNFHNTINGFKRIQDYFELEELRNKAKEEFQQQSRKGPDPKGGMHDVNWWDTFFRGSATDDLKWGEMQTIRPPLELPVREALLAMRPKPGFSGAFRYPLRAVLPVMDGRAFGQRQRRPGGTILVDVSGSMHINSDQIFEAVKRRPAMMVGMYSGTGKYGQLYILARNGRMVASIPDHGRGNIVDGPALQWLAKQRKPRIWISDLSVTGEGDRQAGHLFQEVETIVHKAKIQIYPSLRHFLKAKI